jgi:hypothetical protein
MAKDFFSFGDENQDAGPDTWTGAADQGVVATVAEPRQAELLPEWDMDWAAEEAQRSRGDSEQSSSESREPPSLRAKGAILLVLLASAALVAHLALGALTGGSGASSPPVARTSSVEPSVYASPPGPKATPPRAHVQRGRRDRQRGQSRQRREITRHHARRRRARGGNRRRQTPDQQGTPSRESQAASTESGPPPVAPPPPAEPSSETPSTSVVPPAPEPSSPTPTQATESQFGIEGGQ